MGTGSRAVPFSQVINPGKGILLQRLTKVDHFLCQLKSNGSPLRTVTLNVQVAWLATTVVISLEDS